MEKLCVNSNIYVAEEKPKKLRLPRYKKQKAMIDINKSHLYHYTSFESAVKILTSGKLRFSAYKNVNDINESCGPVVLYANKEDEKKVEAMLKYYLQLSFSMDKVGKRAGYDIPAMWGHYAESGHGVCLAFDSDKIGQNVLERHLYSNAVEYSNGRSLNELVYDSKLHGDAATFIRKAKDSIFFHKSEDWAYEQEYRVIAISDETPLELDIKNCLVGVILFARTAEEFISSVERAALSKITDVDIYRYSTSLGKGGLFDADGNDLNPPLNYDFSDVIKSLSNNKQTDYENQ